MNPPCRTQLSWCPRRHARWRPGVRAILFGAAMSIEGGRKEETDPAIARVSSPYLRCLEEEAPVRVSLSTEPLLSGRRQCPLSTASERVQRLFGEMPSSRAILRLFLACGIGQC
jgi:hypothetical protein